MKILKPFKQGVSISYSLDYRYKNDINSGFSFPCDADGNVSKMHDNAKSNYEACKIGVVRGELVQFQGIREHHHSYAIPAVGKCTCGRHVTLSHSDNECDHCGRIYSITGQELAPRHLWGEETGESF